MQFRVKRLEFMSLAACELRSTAQEKPHMQGFFLSGPPRQHPTRPRRVKNTAQLITLFALSNQGMARRYLLTNTGEVRLQCRKWLPQRKRTGITPCWRGPSCAAAWALRNEPANSQLAHPRAQGRNWLSGSQTRLLASPPLRTVHVNSPAHGSSLC